MRENNKILDTISCMTAVCTVHVGYKADPELYKCSGGVEHRRSRRGGGGEGVFSISQTLPTIFVKKIEIAFWSILRCFLK